VPATPASPRVSIVTPSYNQGRFIRATIESVLSQDYPDVEYIIMDGGSTDETAAIAKEYASRLTFISEPDRGQAHAINKGWAMSTGPILAWLNSDDVLLPGAVRNAVDAIARHPEAGAVYGDGNRIDADGGLLGPFDCTGPFDLWKLIHLEDYILQQTVFFRRDALRAAGWLREDLHYVMDWDILIRIGKQRGLHYIAKPMGCIREYPEAKSFAGGKARLREIAALMKEHAGTRFTPGYFVYALHAWRQILTARVAWPPAQRIINLACGGIADRIRKRGEKQTHQNGRE
jgi:glycosyltransferase involved in cell wall biosynthesis